MIPNDVVPVRRYVRRKPQRSVSRPFIYRRDEPSLKEIGEQIETRKARELIATMQANVEAARKAAREGKQQRAEVKVTVLQKRRELETEKESLRKERVARKKTRRAEKARKKKARKGRFL